MENLKQNGALPVGRVAFAKTMHAQWVAGNSKTILFSALALLATCFGVYQLSGRQGASPSLHIDKAFQNWIVQEAQDLKVYQQLERPMRQHPELQSKFGTAIAQRLLGLGEVKEATKYANAAFKRSHDLNSPYYAAFSKNTLLISEERFAQALENAQQLKLDMLGDDLFWQNRDPFVRSGSILYAYNLLRIAALQCQLGAKEEERIAWNELLENAGWRGEPLNPKTYDPEAYALLAQNFTQGELSLNDYIQRRISD
jgi:hypothetical protein